MSLTNVGVETAIKYVNRDQLPFIIRETTTESLDFIVFITGAFDHTPDADIKGYLGECARVLKTGGLLFVQGIPATLPQLGVYLDQVLTFKYWIAVESQMQRPTQGLPSVHAGVLMFTKGSRFNIRQLRFPHDQCAYCGKPLRDWGGKTHLMNPDGCAASDVWKGLTPADNYTGLSMDVLRCILSMVQVGSTGTDSLFGDGTASSTASRVHGIVGPSENLYHKPATLAEPRIQYCLPGLEKLGLPGQHPDGRDPPSTNTPGLWNVVHQGDAMDILKRYPDNSVDLVFADPPYNLDKAYGAYDDERQREDYLSWCNTWLAEYTRILKPTGSLYVLNLPRWTMYHAAFLNQKLCFQNWIVWDALSEPRGKLMPAHYGLLFYTKHPTDFTFNYAALREIDARYYCLRTTCVRQRREHGFNNKEPLTDIWTDIHRLKHRKDRDYHPCQLPEALLERIIRLSSNPGDVVLDALAGTGTTAVVAAELGRQYVAIDLDEEYARIMRDKLSQVEKQGKIERRSVARPRPRYAKKALQLELRDLTIRLGRLPTPEDVQAHSHYSLDAFYEAFPTWGKALKAAKIVANANGGIYGTNT